MYSIKIDNDNYFTGSYAKVGNVSNGVLVDEIPLNDLGRAKYYKYEREIIPIESPVIDTETGDAVIDKETGLPVTEIKNLPLGRYVLVFDKVKYEKEEIEKLRSEKIAFIDNYKHEVRVEFPYGNCNGIQRFRDSDILFINLTREGFAKGKLTTVNWKYSNGLYDVVTDVEYFDKMIELGGAFLSLSFDVERLIVVEIEKIDTLDGLNVYNEKEKYDETYKSYITSMNL